MIEFAGTYNATIDEKGRVVLPSVFKKELGEHALLPLVIEKNLFKSCLDIYPEIFWKDRVTSFKSTLDPFDEEDDAFLQFFYENFKKVSMAPNGRINIPDEYLGYASLSRNALFIGMGFSIRLWDTGEYDRTKIDKDTFVQRFREKRKNRGDVK